MPNRTRGCWVQSANATSALCYPPPHNILWHNVQQVLRLPGLGRNLSLHSHFSSGAFFLLLRQVDDLLVELGSLQNRVDGWKPDLKKCRTPVQVPAWLLLVKICSESNIIFFAPWPHIWASVKEELIWVVFNYRRPGVAWYPMHANFTKERAPNRYLRINHLGKEREDNCQYYNLVPTAVLEPSTRTVAL